jgi:hypothetical protein
MLAEGEGREVAICGGKSIQVAQEWGLEQSCE